MKWEIILFLVFCVLTRNVAYGQQDLSAIGYSNATNSEVWVEVPEKLQAKWYYGRAERFEIEISGGFHSEFGRVVYLVDARNKLQVVRHTISGGIDHHQLKIYSDDSEAKDSSDKYIVGFRLGNDGGWWSIDIRARSLRDGKWMNLNQTSEPGSGFAEVTPDIKDNFFISSDGKVGINTQSPSHSLAVNGAIKTKEVIVTEQASEWPDYVFTEKGYRGLGLRELEAYIKEHNHLPEIPTKEEIDQNGQNLGAIQAKLLKKIEELVLYTIDQQKLIDNQRKENERLLNRIKRIEEKLNNN